MGIFWWSGMRRAGYRPAAASAISRAKSAGKERGRQMDKGLICEVPGCGRPAKRVRVQLRWRRYCFWCLKGLVQGWKVGI